MLALDRKPGESVSIGDMILTVDSFFKGGVLLHVSGVPGLDYFELELGQRKQLKEKIVVGLDRFKGASCVIGIQAPKEVPIYRHDIKERI